MKINTTIKVKQKTKKTNTRKLLVNKHVKRKPSSYPSGGAELKAYKFPQKRNYGINWMKNYTFDFEIYNADISQEIFTTFYNYVCNVLVTALVIW